MYATVTSLTGRPGGTLAARRTGTAAPVPTAEPARRQAPVRIPTQRPPSDDGRWPLQHRPEAASDARHLAQDLLEDWHLAEDAQDGVLLVVSELVTNAVEHALAPVVLHLHHEHTDHRIWIGVTDGGPAPRDGAWTRSCTHDEHGRGLAVVEAIAEIHGTRTHPGGHTTHWARINPAAA